jgi:hypothetical protein
MWVAGEIIIAQRLLTGRAAASARSAALRQRGDPAVKREMRNYATVEARELG